MGKGWKEGVNNVVTQAVQYALACATGIKRVYKYVTVVIQAHAVRWRCRATEIKSHDRSGYSPEAIS